MNPYSMWQEQTPRQIYELLLTYKALHDDSDPSKGKQKTKSKKAKRLPVKIPDWYKVPEGARVYHVDDVTQSEANLTGV